MFDGFGFFDGFGAFGVIFFAVFALVLVIIVVNLLRGVGTWSRNNCSPRLTVSAEVVAKRLEVSGGGRSAASTWYYVTFEVESGDRMELSVSGEEYGMLSEGDRGELSFQGTRYLGFDRA